MAEIYIRCPAIGCKKVLTVAVECRGLLVTCPHCKQMIRIPQARSAGTPAATGQAAVTVGGAQRGRGGDE